MADTKQILTIELASGDRLRLDQQINDRLESLGYKRFDYGSLGLGFKLDADWPGDQDCEITLAQLTVLAVKLKMRIIVTNLDIVARKESQSRKESDDGNDGRLSG